MNVDKRVSWTNEEVWEMLVLYRLLDGRTSHNLFSRKAGIVKSSQVYWNPESILCLEGWWNILMNECPLENTWGNARLVLTLTLNNAAEVNKLIKRTKLCPGWCGSVDWVPTCEPQGHWFDSQSEHMPGLQARCPVGGAQKTSTHWYFSPSLSPSLSLSKNKYIKS